MARVLVTGANRGVGLELARQYLADGWDVLACCREPQAAGALGALGGALEVLALDVTDGASVGALAARLGGVAIDVLINNAGVMGPRDGQVTGRLDHDAWGAVFAANTVGPARVTEALVDNVAASERRLVALMSTGLASLAEAGGGLALYRSSKTALNMVGRVLAEDLRGRGIAVVMLHPGWVRTDMGGKAASLSPTDSVAGLRTVLAGAGLEDSGRFFRYDGSEIPW